MNKILTLYYIAVVFVVGSTFISTLWTKTMSVQQSSTRSSLQKEVFDLEKRHQTLDRELSAAQALATTTVPDNFEPITKTVALTQASSLLATR